MYKRIVWYLLIIGGFGFLTWLIVEKGSHIPAKELPATQALQPSAPLPSTTSLWSEWAQNLRHPLGLALLQIIVIVLTARAFGRLARYIQQPSVVGEIIAGICLGPSLLGWIWPASSQWLFPADSLRSLFFLSQIGLAFFMFVVGMELDTANIRHKTKHAVMISHVSIIVPFFLGVWLAYHLYPDFAPVHVGFVPFALFMGIAMSITAFPVLARIVQERRLTGTALGSLAITCAAADDITAWCLLAVVVAIVKAGSLLTSILTVGMTILYISAMLYIIKPWLKKRIRRLSDAGNKQAIIALVFIVLLLSALLTEVIGIHALFGAFFAGVIMPGNISIKKLVTDKIADVSMLLLLPLFFAYTGLRTQIGLIGQQQLWLTFGLIMLVAVGGKFGGSAITAKLMGLSWRQSLSIGALMNTRGLMELVVLNIGYELGILSPEIFALLVLMALATTFMTGPLLNRVYRVETPPVKQPEPLPISSPISSL